MNISVFKTAMDTTPQKNISFYTFLDQVKNGEWEDLVHEVRTGKREKKTMPAVTPSGTFSRRNTENIEHHSGIISIDIDIADNEDADIEALKQDPYTWAVHHSIGGRGWVAYFKIDSEKHLQAYYGLEKYLADHYRVVADKSCKDVSRLRYVSWDIDLYKKDKEPKAFKIYVKNIAKEVERSSIIALAEDYQYMAEQIQEKKVDLTNSSYHDWIQIGFALADGLGEQGRTLYHVISSQSKKYDEFQTDAKYNECLKSANGSVSLNTLFYLCSKAGIDTQTEKTKAILRTSQACKSRDSQSQDQQKESALKLLQQKGIEGPEVVLAVSKSFDIDMKSKKAQKSSGEIEAIEALLEIENLRFNVVTQNMEIDGRQFTDREFNTIYIKLRKELGPSVTQALVQSLVDSQNTKGFNPFDEYLELIRDVKSTGHIARLCESIIFKKNPHMSQATIEHFIKKWLIGIIASMHGTYSITLLVLCGGQGIGKTNFFRYLLPDKLRKYYAESKLDLGKDDLILMCNKLIICDDEFGGKSKKEEKLLKDLTAKQVFSVRPPYGKRNIDMQRYAVLCGTSNDTDLLNDLSGNRRIIPIEIEKIDWDVYKSVDKELLFAELYQEFLEIGDKWQLDPVDITVLDLFTQGNKIVCQEEELLLRYFEPANSDGSTYMTNTDILDLISRDTNLRMTSTKLGLALRKHGFTKEIKKINGKTHGLYRMRVKSDVDPKISIDY